jgi:CDP-diacylglycerol--glycerol-3-phosphate 3-phosphatidyltransferase
MNMRDGLFNLPNILTLARIAIVPVFVIFLFFDSRDAGLWAAALFSIAALTDALDGWLARRWDVETSFGKFLDPLADKLIVMSALVMMIPMGRVPAWAVFIILARDVIVSGIRSIASAEGTVIAASDLGKYKTIFQMVAIICLLLHYDYYWLFGLEWEIFHVSMHNVGLIYFYISLGLTIWSGVEYFLGFSRFFTKKSF